MNSVSIGVIVVKGKPGELFNKNGPFQAIGTKFYASLRGIKIHFHNQRRIKRDAPRHNHLRRWPRFKSM